MPGTFNIKWKEGERELTSRETESVHKRMIVSSVSTKFREIDMRKIGWKIPSNKRYRFQDHNNVLDFTSHKL